MAGENVTITYKILLENIQALDEFKRKNQEAETTIKGLETKIKNLTQSQEKHVSAMNRARMAILAMRKELFALVAVAGTLKALSMASDELAERFDKLGRAAIKAFQPLGNMIARMFGGKGELSDASKINLLGIQEEIARLRGNDSEALLKRLEADEIKFNKTILTLSEEKQKIFRQEFEERRKLLIENQRLEELGLRRHQQIFNDFRRDIVSGARGQTGDTLFKLFEGEKQSGAEVLQGFRTAIHRAVADAISSSLFTSLAGILPSGGLKDFFLGKNATTKAVEDVEKKMDDLNRTAELMRNCICRTAENTGFMAANVGRGGGGMLEGTITPPGVPWYQKVGAIADLVGSVASLGSAVGGIGGAPGSIEGGGYVPSTMHKGGFVRAYGGGGEVPITAQAGEFVVRKSVAQRNKDMLKELNMNGEARRSPGGGGNVFLIKANDAASFDDMLSTPSGRERIQAQVIRSIMMNGDLRKTIKSFAN